MKHLRLSTIIKAICLLGLALLFPHSVSCAAEHSYIENEAIVVFKNQVATTYATGKLAQATNHETKVDDIYYFDSFNVGVVSSDLYTTDDLITKLKATPGVVCAEPNYYCIPLTTPNDAYYNYQWALKNSGNYGGTSGCDTQSQALSDAQVDGSECVVAVVDTGVDYTHEDLKNNMWVDSSTQSCGYDSLDKDNDPMDTYGHGTHCAGIIAAEGNNETGISGIAPKAKIMALRFMDGTGKGKVSEAISAYEYIQTQVNKGVNVVAVNNSWGYAATEGELHNNTALSKIVNELGTKGIISVFASGNDGSQITQNHYPVETNNNYCITVGSTDNNDNLSSFSNYSSDAVDVAAPGGSIISTVSYTNFIPYLYDTSKRNELCSSYTTFDQSSDLNALSSTVTDSHLSINLSYDSHNVDGSNSTGGSIKVTYRNRSRNNEDFALYFTDSTSTNYSTGTYYTSFLVESDNDWQTYSETYTDADKENNGLPIFTLSVSANSSGEFYIDNLGISKIDPDDTSVYGKYDIYSGTSMAAPYVSGALALLRQTAPKFSAAQMKTYLLKNIRTVSGLSGKVKTSGVLDLSHYKSILTSLNQAATTPKPTVTPTPSTTPTVVAVKRVKIKAPRKWVRVGKKLKLSAVVYPSRASNKKVKWSVNKKKYATISSKGILKAKKKGAGKSVVVTLRSKANKAKFVRLKIRIRKK